MFIYTPTKLVIYINTKDKTIDFNNHLINFINPHIYIILNYIYDFYLFFINFI